MLIQVIYLVCAYLLGSIPYMLLLGRARGYDLSHETDLHMALYRKVGRIEGASGIAVDFLKGIIAVLAGFLLRFDLVFVAAAAILVTCGQMWPVFQRFNGEKGNTTGLAAIATLLIAYDEGWIFYVGISIIFIGFLVRTTPRFMSANTWYQRLSFGGPASNSLPLGMFIGFAMMPLIAGLVKIRWEITLALLLIFVFIIIRRLTARVRTDIRERRSSISRILINRLLFDRSYY